jgi:DNA-binding CsgD family transcriptional regulator
MTQPRPEPSPSPASARGRRLKARTAGPDGAPRITPAERRVLVRLLDDERPAEIAAALGVHVGTVWSHITNLRAKFGAKDIAELLQRAAPPADGGPSVGGPPSATPGTGGGSP